MSETKTAPVEQVNGEQPITIDKLTKAQLSGMENFSREQALALVGMYTNIQKFRVGASNKISAHNRNADLIADPAIINLLKEDLLKVEKKAKRALKAFAMAQPLGRWAMTNLGVGEIFAAGFLAHIDLTRCTCPGFRDMKVKPAHECAGLATAGSI